MSSSVSSGATRILMAPPSTLREFDGSGGSSVAGFTLNSDVEQPAARTEHMKSAKREVKRGTMLVNLALLHRIANSSLFISGMLLFVKND